MAASRRTSRTTSRRDTSPSFPRAPLPLQRKAPRRHWARLRIRNALRRSTAVAQARRHPKRAGRGSLAPNTSPSTPARQNRSRSRSEEGRPTTRRQGRNGTRGRSRKSQPLRGLLRMLASPRSTAASPRMPGIPWRRSRGPRPASVRTWMRGRIRGQTWRGRWKQVRRRRRRRSRRRRPWKGKGKRRMRRKRKPRSRTRRNEMRKRKTK
mmetsp:Transcript_114467/g.323650  ORF Transcript_114467/g.323650 Transcript_114467/m.323650 type:complete len:209 (+) Transcript_114467:156-782(+)